MRSSNPRLSPCPSREVSSQAEVLPGGKVLYTRHKQGGRLGQSQDTAEAPSLLPRDNTPSRTASSWQSCLLSKNQEVQSTKAPCLATPSQSHDLCGAFEPCAQGQLLTNCFLYLCVRQHQALAWDFSKCTCQHKHSTSKIKQSNLKQAQLSDQLVTSYLHQPAVGHFQLLCLCRV